jgi:D-arginine dehydrogenase
MSSARVVIVGAGIAGAATAYFLAQRGCQKVILLDREKQPGVHSTGRNAAILRTAISQPALHALARESKRFYSAPPAGFTDVPLIDPVGLYLAAPGDHDPHLPEAGTLAKLKSWLNDPACSTGGVEVDPDQLYAAYPQLAKRLDYAMHFPDEGVFDVDAILSGFLRGARQAGVEIRLCTEATSLEMDGDQVIGVQTNDGPITASQVVLAGGGWAAELATRVKLEQKLQPIRRHILVTARLAELDPRNPVVWVGGDEFYFRPESGGLLMSSCDTEVVSAAQGELAQAEVIEAIAEKAERWLPGFEQLGAAHFWAGMRTFAPDPLFVVGPDSRVQGLHWAAGLGGHGITCGAAVGRLAAEWICDSWSGLPYAQELLPRVPS